MRRFYLVLSQIIVIVLLACIFQLKTSQVGASAIAKNSWASVRSSNFYIVGEAGERELRKVALNLEQFRAVFTTLFPKAKLTSSVPTRVIVFKNNRDFKPFMPLYQGKTNEVGGYFLSSEGVNYIALSAELRQSYPYATVFHEYVHSLTSENSRALPTWFNEGLAEYYSTFDVTDGGKKFWLGKVLDHHVLFLREKKFLPLDQLLQVTRGSATYNERDKRGVFYAQSWALVHFLMLGENGRRRPGLIKYLGLLNDNVPAGEAFSQAFQSDYVSMENELRNYIYRNTYPVQTFTVDQKLEVDSALRVAPVSDAEGLYYLGDLLLHNRRYEDAETKLKEAVELDPELALAYSSLGMLKMRQKLVNEARKHLQEAVRLGSDNYLVHYYYAYVLSREGMDQNNFVQRYSPESVESMREHLEKVIQLNPDFAESYFLLGFINLVQNEKLDSAAGLFKRVLSISPGRHQAGLMLSQVYLRQQKLDLARQVAETYTREGNPAEIRTQAESIIDNITRLQAVTQVNKYTESNRTGSQPSPSSAGVRDAVLKDVGDRRPINLRRQFDGQKTRGELTAIDCDFNDTGITLVVKSGDRLVRFHTPKPEDMEFITHTSNVGADITCGPISPTKPVIISWRKPATAKAGIEGEPVIIEFLKPNE